MIGLSKDANAFLSKRLSENPPTQPPSIADQLRPEPLRKEIALAGMSISYEHDLTPSSWSNAIREAFGIDKTVATITGVHELGIRVQPRDLWYIWGPSGSGKTGLLEVLGGMREPTAGSVANLSKSDCAIFSLNFEDKPAIEQMGSTELAHALFSMNAAGLSEAALYFKRPDALSAGQRHRLAIARLIASKKPVWIIDEFCSVLDDTTAAIVSKNVGRTARSLGVTAFIAGPRREPVLSALRPDFVLNLDSLGSWKTEPFKPL